MPNRYFSFQKKHKITYLVILSLLTIFFLINALNLEINADFSSIFSQTESQIYKVHGDFNQEEINQLLESYNQIKKIDSKEIAKEPIPENLSDSVEFDYPATTISETDEPTASSLLLMIKSKDFFTPVFLNTLDICLQNLENSSQVQSISSVFDYITIEKKGTRLAVTPISSHKPGELWTNEEVETLKQKLAKDPTITGYLVSQNLDAVMFVLNISNLNENEIYDLLNNFEPLDQFGGKYAITGALPINYRIMHYLSHDLTLLLFLCFIVILIVFYLSFRAKRAMILPSLLSIIAIIWTFGTMALLDIPITIVNIITPCMVLILGSSYSVHIVSEYFAKYNLGTIKNLAEIAASHIYRTIIFAGLTTIAGFISLMISKVSGLRDFGIVVSIGIVYCIILSLTLLPIILSLISLPKDKQTEVVENGFLTKTIKKTSSFVVKNWIWFCVLYVIIIFGFIYTKDKISVDTNYMEYFPSSDKIVEDTKDISTIFGGDIPYKVTITAPEGSEKYFLDPVNLKKVYDFETTVTQSPDILQNISFSSYVAYLNELYNGKNEIPTNPALLNLFNRLMILLREHNAGLINQTLSEDGNTLTIFLQCYDSINNDLTTVTSSQKLEDLMLAAMPLLPNDCSVEFGGTNADALRFSTQLIKDQNNSQIIAYLLVFLIAGIAFKSIFRGLLTLVPVSVGVMANYIFMYLLNIPFDMVTVSFACVAIGAGVDDAIHFLLKYSTLVSCGDNHYKDCLKTTIIETGRPIVLTTISIVMGMIMLTFGSYMPIKYFGVLMSVALMNSMLATIIILPAVIILFTKIKNLLKIKN
ncbi:MAG: efflux RND transporter permease subunit [Pleomorphochaeta sp.]